MAGQLDPQIYLGEVKLRISSMERSIRFYEDVVGLSLLSRSEDGRTAALSADGGAVPLLMLEEIPNAVIPQRRGHAGLYHFAILVPDRKTLSLVARHLTEKGIYIGQADHLVSEALYINDPDNNGIEIYADRPRSQWKRDANGDYAMATDPIQWESLIAESKGAEWSGLPAGTVIGHVHLHVGDLNTSGAFYTKALGFDMAGDYSQTMRALFISAGGYHHHIGMNIWAGLGAALPPDNTVGLDYFTVMFPGSEARERLLAHLRGEGIAVAIDGEDAIIHDPTGIEIRLRVGG